DVIVDAVNSLIAVAGQMQHGFTHSLGRNGARIDARAADHFAFLNQGDALAEFCALNGRALPGGSRTHDDKIKVIHLYFPKTIVVKPHAFLDVAKQWRAGLELTRFQSGGVARKSGCREPLVLERKAAFRATPIPNYRMKLALIVLDRTVVTPDYEIE